MMRSQIILEQTIENYIHEKTKRTLSPWVSRIRNQEISHIRNEIIAKSKDESSLIESLLAYLPEMHKNNKEGKLPMELRNAIRKILENKDEKNLKEDPSYKEQSGISNDSSKKELSENSSQTIWYKKYFSHLLDIMKKSTDDIDYLTMVSILLGPTFYTFNNLQSHQASLNMRMKKLELRIEMEAWKNVYLAFKPYEEKIYRINVFEHQIKHIQDQYKQDTLHIDKDLKSIITGISHAKITFEYTKALHHATEKTTTTLLKEHKLKKENSLKKCDEIKQLVMKNSDNYKVDEESLKITFSPLSKEIMIFFSEYEKNAKLDKKNILSNSSLYTAIRDEIYKKIAGTYDELARSFILECSESKPSEHFNKSISMYIMKRTKYYYDKLLENMIYPLKWQEKNIVQITQTLYKRYDALKDALINTHLYEIKNNSYLESARLIQENYEKMTQRWVKSHSKKIPEFYFNEKNFTHDIIESGIGSISPCNIKEIKTGKSIVGYAMELYKDTLQKKSSNSKKLNTIALLMELISKRGAIIEQSPSFFYQNDYDYQIMYNGWILLMYSLKNIPTLSDVSLLIKNALLDYCDQSAEIIHNYSGYFAQRKLSPMDELKRMDKVFSLLQTLFEAFDHQDDTKLLQSIAELKCDHQVENGVLHYRLPLNMFAKNLLEKIHMEKDALFYITQNLDKFIRTLTPIPLISSRVKPKP